MSQAGQAIQAYFKLHQEFQACRSALAKGIPQPWASDGEAHDQAMV